MSCNKETRNKKLLAGYFLDLPQPEERVQCEHVWVDGSLKNFRTKSKTWEKGAEAELPPMEFCGSATDFDVGNLADYYAHPVHTFKDPFRGGSNLLVLCDTYSNQGLPTFANNRFRLDAAEKKSQLDLKFSFFQDYSLQRKDGRPLTYMDSAYDKDSKAHFSCGRPVAESHFRACLYSRVGMESLEDITGRGQWRYCVGPCVTATSLGDHVWMSRFLLQRVAEDFGVTASFDETPALTSSVLIETTLERRGQIADVLESKFIVTEHRPVRVLLLSRGVLLSDLHADVDPYAICEKAVDALCAAL